MSTGCTSSSDALFYACESIIHRRADIVIRGGVDAPLAPGILEGFCLMRILTESWNDHRLGYALEKEYGETHIPPQKDEPFLSSLRESV